MPPAFGSRLRAFAARVRPYDTLLYTLWAALSTLLCARAFYGAMMAETSGEWSAPLDDVFIHFDYARSIAQGHPFEWTVGNGYSSGNTSILYPFVLAIGYLAGFQGQTLMLWAGVIAATCVFGVLLACRSVFFLGVIGGDWGRLGAYLLPPLFLGLGALNWSLWSGMEVAFFLGLWAIGLACANELDHAPPSKTASRAWLFGAAGFILVLTRPEAVTTVGVFALASSFTIMKRDGFAAASFVFLRCVMPAAALVVVQALVNRALTGEYSASGAIVKLAVNSPFLTPDEKLADYIFNLKYSIQRNTEYHFSDVPVFGMLMPALAFGALATRETRRAGLILWGQIAGWLLLTALNGQVRWQNERYTMPAVAWLLIAAAIGAVALAKKSGRPNIVLTLALGALALQAVGVATRPPNTNPEIRYAWTAVILGGSAIACILQVWPLRVIAVAVALFLAHQHQEKNERGQRWFFGRAARNIRDQHIVAGRWLAHYKPKRILVGDAGALVYASDAPGLDIIGLGGYHQLPFARAGVHGLPATLELIERMPDKERPDVLAIFPTWWGVLPTWFSSGVLARFPAEGNVICGGYEDVLYRADWHLLGTGEAPREIPEGESVRDSVDIADLVSEKEHSYFFPQPAGGWTNMKILPDPSDEKTDMFDAGRRIAPGRAERFKLRNLKPNHAAHLLIRSAPETPSNVFVRINGAPLVQLSFEKGVSWVEAVATLPENTVGETIDVELWNQGPADFVDYHVWVTQ
ncbi:MAG: hypothetical protein ABI461_11115 [Polyangiaceae bacterium]